MTPEAVIVVFVTFCSTVSLTVVSTTFWASASSGIRATPNNVSLQVKFRRCAVLPGIADPLLWESLDAAPRRDENASNVPGTRTVGVEHGVDTRFIVSAGVDFVPISSKRRESCDDGSHAA